MSVAFQILKEDDRYALYQDGVLINTYSHKDSVTHRIKRILEHLIQKSSHQSLEQTKVSVLASKNYPKTTP